jgi:nitrous oxidase accessory protein NosD
MRFKNILLIVLFLLITAIFIGSVAAGEDSNFTQASPDLELSDSSDLDDVKLSASNAEEALSSGKNISVDNDGEYHREMNDHTIRDAIRDAESGDTIVVNGEFYDHVHIVINKQLTIRSDVATKLSPCSSTATSGHQGIFYLTSQASGTVIEGFSFITEDINGEGMLFDSEGYAILINGATNVTIRNCSFSNDGIADAIRLENAKSTVIEDVEISNTVNGIKIKNCEDITVRNSIIKDSTYGIYDADSLRTAIAFSNIHNNDVGVTVLNSSKDSTISFNNITRNGNGIELTSSDNINILSNYIAENTNHGVYVNCKIQKINITGNFFYKNIHEEVFNDVNTKGLYVKGGEYLEIVNNNYFVGLDNRPVQREDSVGGGVFLGYAFEINTYVACPIIYATYGVNWYKANYRLQLSNITQIKKGVYSISIVDADGNPAKGLSSVPVTFYLNKDNNYVAPQNGDVYKTVMMVDGTATVRFYPEDFDESGNFVTAVLPGTSEFITGDQFKNIKNFTIEDKYIPGNVTVNTTIEMSNITIFDGSSNEYTITLKDINGEAITNEPVVFDINSKTIKTKTDENGKATIKIDEPAGYYTIKVYYDGDDIEWAPSLAQVNITVKEEPSQPSQDNANGSSSQPSQSSSPVSSQTSSQAGATGGKLSTRIVASNSAMFIKKSGYYRLTLKDANGNPLANQKVTIKVNKKTYKVKTNSKGVAKVKLKLKKGTYKVKITYKGNNKYNAAKATKKIKVKKVLKTKLTAPKVTIAPKTSSKYIVTLKDENGNPIKKQKVTIKVNGKKYSKKTNGKGQATIKVKFSKLKSYKVKVNYKGNKQYKKSSKTGKITVKKVVAVAPAPSVVPAPSAVPASNATATPDTQQNDAGNEDVNSTEENIVRTVLTSYDRSFSLNSTDSYIINLKDSSGKALANHQISYTLDNQSYSQNTDENGQLRVNVSFLGVGSYSIHVNHAKTENYSVSSSNSTITILNKTGITFIDGGLPNDEMQGILDETMNPVEFLANVYSDVSLNLNRSSEITFQKNTVLNGKKNKPVLIISVSNFNVSNLIINADEGEGIVIENAGNITISNNTISNDLNSSKARGYESGEIAIPGNGISLVNANNVKLSENEVRSFGNAVLAQNSSDVEITNNTFSLSNYGINYGLGVKNTIISNNLITKNIGLYVMNVPEGPLGYGIFLNRSAVNVSIIGNMILDNYMGISVDANYSTGIVILRNWISDNALEGIRFNAGYDLAENAVEPDVNDNAIYRNARGPSMMILGELSANPDGIYHYGEFNETKRLQLGTNWYGKNARITWDYATNTVGYGTMCPRIATTYISVKEIEVVSPGIYQVKFYKNDTVASNLSEFEMFATLNDDVEVRFMVVNGVGTFSFDKGYKIGSNEVKVSIGSLKDQYRTFEVLLNKTIEVS